MQVIKDETNPLDSLRKYQFNALLIDLYDDPIICNALESIYPIYWRCRFSEMTVGNLISYMSLEN